jgi:hypothetical protein
VEARRFWAEQVGTKEAEMSVQELEGYDEVMLKMLEDIPPELRLAGLAPEQRLAGLAPEQRLAGLTPEQAILALPDEVLRGLPQDYLATLSEPTRAAIRKRLGR